MYDKLIGNSLDWKYRDKAMERFSWKSRRYETLQKINQKKWAKNPDKVVKRTFSKDITIWEKAQVEAKKGTS